MSQDADLRSLLDLVARGELSPGDAEARLRLPGQAGYQDLGYSKVDTDRRRRRGVAEAVFCQGKTPEHILAIACRLDEAGQTVICTRVTQDAAVFVRSARPDFEYCPSARLLYKRNEEGSAGDGVIAVITAGTTDIPVAEEAALCAELWGNRVERVFDVGVAGLHRIQAARPVLERSRVVITVAGMEGALPSVIAGLVAAPVIGVPTSVGYGASFGGVAALLGMLNSCSGGLAVVNIDNGFGAALLAHMINRADQIGK